MVPQTISEIVPITVRNVAKIFPYISLVYRTCSVNCKVVPSSNEKIVAPVISTQPELLAVPVMMTHSPSKRHSKLVISGGGPIPLSSASTCPPLEGRDRAAQQI